MVSWPAEGQRHRRHGWPDATGRRIVAAGAASGRACSVAQRARVAGEKYAGVRGVCLPTFTSTDLRVEIVIFSNFLYRALIVLFFISCRLELWRDQYVERLTKVLRHLASCT